MSISFSDVTNGSWWEAPFPQCWRGQVQWLDNDKWVLLIGEPGFVGAKMTHQIKVGALFKIILTKSELTEYLNRLPWAPLEVAAARGEG